MQILVLGSAAGGGFPQWNCNCDLCAGVRHGRLRARPRTQSSIALSVDGENWLLINASPDIRGQLTSLPALQPERAKRDSGVAAVMLTDSQIDHTTGLLILRESDRPLTLYCTDRVYADLTTGFPVLNMLGHYCGVDRRAVPTDGSSLTVDFLPKVEITPVHLSSKAPPYSPHRAAPRPGDNIGLFFRDHDTGGSLFYAPGLGDMDEHLLPFFERASCLLVDGTTWTDDEMSVRGVGVKRASEMGHLCQSGPGGMIERLDRYPGKRRILIHINNTNPILDEDSPERAELSAHGIEVAHDGMVIDL